jgi:hypothetical protein
MILNRVIRGKREEFPRQIEGLARQAGKEKRES